MKNGLEETESRPRKHFNNDKGANLFMARIDKEMGKKTIENGLNAVF